MMYDNDNDSTCNFDEVSFSDTEGVGSWTFHDGQKVFPLPGQYNKSHFSLCRNISSPSYHFTSVPAEDCKLNSARNCLLPFLTRVPFELIFTMAHPVYETSNPTFIYKL